MRKVADGNALVGRCLVHCHETAPVRVMNLSNETQILHPGTSIQIQKQYHDRKANYEQFKVNDIVYVYFLVKKIGQTPKFSPFWRGPFTIFEKCSDVLYKVNCERNGLVQLVYINTWLIKKAQKQEFTYESDILASPGIEPKDLIPDEAGIEVLYSEDIEKDSRFGRTHKKPVCMNGYVSSNFREKQAMPQTKTTPGKREVEKAI